MLLSGFTLWCTSWTTSELFPVSVQSSSWPCVTLVYTAPTGRDAYHLYALMLALLFWRYVFTFLLLVFYHSFFIATIMWLLITQWWQCYYMLQWRHCILWVQLPLQKICWISIAWCKYVSYLSLFWSKNVIENYIYIFKSWSIPSTAY